MGSSAESAKDYLEALSRKWGDDVHARCLKDAVAKLQNVGATLGTGSALHDTEAAYEILEALRGFAEVPGATWKTMLTSFRQEFGVHVDLPEGPDNARTVTRLPVHEEAQSYSVAQADDGQLSAARTSDSGQFENGDNIVALARRAVEESDWQERWKAAKSLSYAYHDTWPALEFLLAALTRERRWDHRRNAVQAISCLNDGRCRSALEKALVDARREVRYYAAEALGNLAARESAPVLRKIAEADDSKYVRECASIALERVEQAAQEVERKAAQEAAAFEAKRKAAEVAEPKAAQEAAALEAKRKAAEEAEHKAAQEAAALEAKRKAAEEALRPARAAPQQSSQVMGCSSENREKIHMSYSSNDSLLGMQVLSATFRAGREPTGMHVAQASEWFEEWKRGLDESAGVVILFTKSYRNKCKDGTSPLKKEAMAIRKRYEQDPAFKLYILDNETVHSGGQHHNASDVQVNLLKGAQKMGDLEEWTQFIVESDNLLDSLGFTDVAQFFESEKDN